MHKQEHGGYTFLRNLLFIPIYKWQDQEVPEHQLKKEVEPG